MELITYRIPKKIDRAYRIALIADLHDRPVSALECALAAQKPDFIAICGDLVDGTIAASMHAPAFMKFCAETAPTFYSIGNHDRFIGQADLAMLTKLGITVLDDAEMQFKGLRIGGLTSGGMGSRHAVSPKEQRPNLKWLSSYSKGDGFKLLLCHHPEYYESYLKKTTVDLILSGHAHGGQIRFLGRGLYAPGQGLFPKYTSGVYDNRLIVSRGLSNTGGPIPRLFNKTELVIVELIPAQ